MSDGSNTSKLTVPKSDLALFDAVSHHPQDAVLLHDHHGTIVAANERAGELYGFHPDELIGSTFMKLNSALTFSDLDKIGSKLRQERCLIFDAEHRHRSGLAFSVEVCIRRLPETDSWLTFVRDISARRQTEVELRRQQQLSAEAQSLAKLGCFEWDIVENKVTWSDELYLIYGLRPQEFGATLEAFMSRIVPEDRDHVQATLQRALAECSSFHMEERIVRADGEVRVLESRGQVIVDDAGHPIRMVGACLDITERKRNEEQLQANKLFIERIAVASPHLLYVFDRSQNDFIYTNRLVAADLGYAPEEIAAQGLNVFTLLHPDDREDIPAMLERWDSITDDQVVVNDFRLRGPNDKWFWFRSTEAAFTRDEQGKVIQIIGTAQNITERRMLEEQVQQIQKMDAVGRLAGGVAHDFNNLLTVVNNYGEILLDSIPDDEELQEPVTAILDAGARGARLTRQLLAFSRKAVVESTQLDLNNVVKESEELLRRLIGEDVLLKVELSYNLGQVKANAGQLEQIILNIAVNARDAMPTGGTLTLRTDRRAMARPDHPDSTLCEHVVLEIIDSGCGMTKDVKDSIFEPFFTTKPKGTGTGLGLSVVHGAVKQNGGFIQVDSEVGVGTAFRIFLPAVGATTKGVAATDKPQPQRGTGTLLLVEDEDGVRRVTKRVLEGLGYTVIEAANGAQALRVVSDAKDEIQLVVTDVVMPGMSGRQLVEELRKSQPGIRVVYMSGYTDDAVLQHGVIISNDSYLQKPFSSASLAQKVRAALDRPEE